MESVQASQESQNRGTWIWYLPLVAVVILAVFLLRRQIVPALDSLQALVESAGVYGPPILVVAIGVWATLLLPGPLIVGLAGTVFADQPLKALAVSSLGFLIAQAVAFTLARFFLRDLVREKVGNQGWFLWLEEQVKQKGAPGVLVARMLPFFPNSLANYGFGLTKISFWSYLVATWVGTLPILLFYIFGTAGFVHLLRGAS